MNHLHYLAGSPPDQPPRPASDQPQYAVPHLIGEHVRTARTAAHMTQQELAGITYSKSYISALERGRMIPSLQALHFLAERLGVPVSYLLGEDVPVEEGRRPAAEGTKVPEKPTVPAGHEQQMNTLNEAERLLREGRYEEALALFEQAGQPERTNHAREVYAQFLADQGRYQEAYEQMRRALAGTED